MYPNHTLSRENEPWYANFLQETTTKSYSDDGGAASTVRSSLLVIAAMYAITLIVR